MTADERRGVILDIICARRYETIDNLAFELDASRRTIERDVLHLSLRFPIYFYFSAIIFSVDFRENYATIATTKSKISQTRNCPSMLCSV